MFLVVKCYISALDFNQHIDTTRNLLVVMSRNKAKSDKLPDSVVTKCNHFHENFIIFSTWA